MQKTMQARTDKQNRADSQARVSRDVDTRAGREKGQTRTQTIRLGLGGTSYELNMESNLQNKPGPSCSVWNIRSVSGATLDTRQVHTPRNTGPALC